jgi:hypothetical protein
MNSLNKPDFENGNAWNSIPPRMKRSAKGIFILPEPMRRELLPDPNLSIKLMTDFLLPSQHSVLAQELICLSQFFSKEPPSIISKSLTMQLRQLPIPDPTIIQRLVEFSHQAWLDGFRSVSYAHLQPVESGPTICFPLWIIAFWNEVLDIRKISFRWIKCRDWVKVQLQQKKSPERRQLAEQTSIILTILPWGQSKPKGLSNGSDPIHMLWRYLGPNWLSDSEQDEMLELIRDRCLDSPEKCSQFRIENTHFPAKLLEAFDAGSNAYLNSSSFAWLHHLGEDIAKEGSTVITVVHLGALNDMPHWVPLTIQRTGIGFGDSFGKEMPEKLQTACLWWLRQHHAQVAEICQPSIHRLSITTQIDTHSCGILADNALDHYINGAQSPLLGNSTTDIIAQRLKKFNIVSQHIIARVCTFINQFELVILIAQHKMQLEHGTQNTSVEAEPDIPDPLIPTIEPIASPRKRARINTPEIPTPDTDTFAPFSPPALSPDWARYSPEIPTPDVEIFTPFSPPPFSPDWARYDDDDENFEPSSPTPTIHSPVAVTSPSASPPKSKITSFWNIASAAEKEEMSQSGFQSIRDRQEEVAANTAADARWKLMRGRTQARERQQAHRDRSKEKKMEAGWIPGEKRVSVFLEQSVHKSNTNIKTTRNVHLPLKPSI